MAEGNRLLSDEEMDAIGEVVSSGELDGGYNVDVETSPFDLVANNGRHSVDTSVLKQINDRFRRFFRANLRKELNHQMENSDGAIEICEYGKILEDEKTPISLNVTRISPLKGESLLSISSGVIFSCVDAWFGGGADGKTVESADRQFSATEELVAKKMRISLYSALIEGWAPSLEVQCELSRAETDPALLDLLGPSELVVANRFRVGEEDNPLGHVILFYPLESIKLIRSSMVTIEPTKAKENRLEKLWTEKLRTAVGGVDFDAVVEAVKIPISLGELENLQVGDTINLRDLEDSELKVNGVSLFKVEIGSQGASTAIKILTDKAKEAAA